MGHLYMEGVIFGCFLMVAVIAHHLEQHPIHLRKPLPKKVMMALGLLAHPSVFDALREYTVHLLVYSGMVVPGH